MPPSHGAPDPRMVAGPDADGPSSRHNRRGLYQEWRRDRPVEATTTYRCDVGKVPNPGRCLLRDKGTPSGAPRSDQVVRVRTLGPDPRRSLGNGDRPTLTERTPTP